MDTQKRNGGLKKIDVARQPLALIITTAAIIIALAAVRYILSSTAPLPSAMPAGRWLEGAWGEGWRMGLMGVLLIMNSLMLTHLGTHNMLYGAKTYLPAVAYLASCCGLFFARGSLAPLTASFFIVWGLTVLIPGFRHGASFDRCFRGALLVGCSALFYAPAAVMVVGLPLIMAVILRSLREQIVALVGLLLPFALVSYLYWAMGYEGGYLFHTLVATLFAPAGVAVNLTHPMFITTAALTVLALFLSVGTFAATATTMRTRQFRIVLLLVALLVVLAGGLALPGRSMALMQLVAVPMGLVMPIYFARYTGRWPLVIYLVWILSVMGMNILRL